MKRLVISFDADYGLMSQITPTLANVTLEVGYLLETIISKDEELYKEKWGHELIHTDRDRVVAYMSEYLTKPLVAALKQTYVYDGTPESKKAIVEDIRKKIDSDEIISNVEVDFQGLEFSCNVVIDGKMEEQILTADELIDTTALQFMQTKLCNLYKKTTKDLIAVIDNAIEFSGFHRHDPFRMR
tara:strand:+ start:5317 stop:5871 length:555 start_codon:yes stop_codon:yes gene_type:complete